MMVENDIGMRCLLRGSTGGAKQERIKYPNVRPHHDVAVVEERQQAQEVNRQVSAQEDFLQRRPGRQETG